MCPFGVPHGPRPSHRAWPPQTLVQRTPIGTQVTRRCAGDPRRGWGLLGPGSRGVDLGGLGQTGPPTTPGQVCPQTRHTPRQGAISRSQALRWDERATGAALGSTSLAPAPLTPATTLGVHKAANRPLGGGVATWFQQNGGVADQCPHPLPSPNPQIRGTTTLNAHRAVWIGNAASLESQSDYTGHGGGLVGEGGGRVVRHSTARGLLPACPRPMCSRLPGVRAPTRLPAQAGCTSAWAPPHTSGRAPSLSTPRPLAALLWQPPVGGEVQQAAGALCRSSSSRTRRWARREDREGFWC
jgi:hypothetical protein